VRVVICDGDDVDVGVVVSIDVLRMCLLCVRVVLLLMVGMGCVVGISIGVVGVMLVSRCGGVGVVRGVFVFG